MAGRITVFVVDTGPLITLAAARSLDYLLYVEGTAVVIPDAVLYEATHDASRLGAPDILSWVKAHRDRIEIAPTNAYVVFDAARQTDPNIRQVNLGEQAAVEVIEEPGRLRPEERGILLCEESAVLRRIVVREKDRIIELSTMDFLRLLEAEGRIQSADAVFQMAVEGGRSPSNVQHLTRQSDELRATIAGLVQPRRTSTSQ